MTDTTLDPFDVIRGELLRAATRDVSRRRHRVRVLRVAFASLGALVLLTGIAAAASERVADVVGKASEGILDVFHGPASTEQPSVDAQEFLRHIQGGAGRSIEDAGPLKVLLKERIDGIDVEATVFERPGSQPGSEWGDHDICVQFRWGSGDASSGGGAMASCGPQFIPFGVPGNVGVGHAPVRRPDVGEDIVNGVLTDDVVAVNVVTATGLHPATMGDHVVWYSTEERVSEVQLITRDGWMWTLPRIANFGTCVDAPDRTACERAMFPRTRVAESRQ
ncbi:MAG: hypothetical protein H7247_03915 [Polaromonas sp.]|nr:hypothetical protein [Gemmatimonadaceae bacterium]